ncbi:Dps family protein [Paenibacillus sp. JX-17]|uniref:Dps family protein n=1 Tax=Paenibacillus lacisoli TaxID=3064525 RepID=A0ABT9CAZ2_9BACL|nr:Dps family protein [Paenibacillus sp. JX-17]MDO7906412.1 Dps family protein [Paenibacillus sp. JX-17]
MSTQTVNTTSVQLQESLNRQIASFSILYTKLHNFHWYVKGPQFFTLHAKFEELYDEAAEQLDTVAERLLAIGGRPAATLSEHLKLSVIEEAGGSLSAEQMVKAVIDDFGKLSSELDNGIEAAETADDAGTADLLTGIRKGLDKHRWMLNAFLGR